MSDAALQQEFPDPDGQLGMPTAPAGGLSESLTVAEVDLTDAEPSGHQGRPTQPTLSGADPDGADESAALAR
jgi:hypothetical protein